MSTDQDSGKITVRSNVVLEPGRWDLVPGELLHALRRNDKATRLQHDEHMYYEPCSVCRRTIAAINLSGCNQCTYAPSPAARELARNTYRHQLDEARRRELEENAALRASGRHGTQSHAGKPAD